MKSDIQTSVLQILMVLSSLLLVSVDSIVVVEIVVSQILQLYLVHLAQKDKTSNSLSLST